MTDLSRILRPMLLSTKEQAYIPFLFEVVTSSLCKCIQQMYSFEVLMIQTSREIILLSVFGTLGSCANPVSWTAQTRITSAAGSVACVLFTKWCCNDL